MTIIKDSNALTHFNERATSWKHLYNRPQFQDRLSLFVNGIKNSTPPPSTILDYGCGTGQIAMELAACGYQVVGVDGSKRMIEEARAEAEKRKLSSVTFETIEPTTWHPRQMFEAIICSSVLEYIPDDESLLIRFAEALNPGGTLLISIPYALSLTGFIKNMFHIGCRLLNTHTHDIQFAQHRYTRTAFTQALKRTGFETPTWTSFELPMVNFLGVQLSRIPLIGVMILANSRRCINR
jgi:2-polyprenyl-3-methyl-5-hydroxy-6-metoxy-1,4-benzoquinol methylase